MRDTFGICQWFNFNDKDSVDIASTYLHELGIHHLRMNVSWADYCRPQGRAWYEWLFDALEEFQILPCIWHTLPSPFRSSEARSDKLHWHAKHFTEFLFEFLETHGHRFDTIELRNPSTRLKRGRGSNSEMQLAADAIDLGSGVTLPFGKKFALGGIDPSTNELQASPEALKHVDVIGIHAFPKEGENPNETWHGWRYVFDHLNGYEQGHDIWVTETGCPATNRASQKRQMDRLMEAVVQGTQCAKRIYWYSLLDLPENSKSLQFPREYKEPLERSLGLVTAEGYRKEAFYTLKSLLSSE